MSESAAVGGAANVAIAQREHSNVYVRGLPGDCDEGSLSALFAPHADVQSVRLFRSNQNPSKAPFAFVKCGSVDEAAAAIEALNGTECGGSIIEVRFAENDAKQPPPASSAAASILPQPPPSESLYVKNLPFGFVERDLRQLFEQFGIVAMSRVLHKGDAAGHGGAALVRMASLEDAARAVLQLQGRVLQGASQPLVVRFADNAQVKAKKQARSAAGSAPPAYPPGQQASSSQSGVPWRMPPPERNNPYGSLAAASAAVAAPHPGSMQMPLRDFPAPRGGYLQAPDSPVYWGPGPSYQGPSYQGPSSSYLPSSYMQQDVYPPLTQASNLNMGLPGSSAAPRPATPSVASLYIKNLPAEADRLFLYEKFSPFGAILSVKILSDDTGSSKGVGFVNYADSSSASRAVSALNNLVVGDRVLHVAFQTHRKL